MLRDMKQVPISVDKSGLDLQWWKMKCAKVEEQYALVKSRTEELEERILNIVEKSESDKLLLSEETDELYTRLCFASNRIVALEHECAKYKKDCALAVHLLQCQPTHYIDKDKASQLSPDEQNFGRTFVSPIATYPPMAVYFPELIDISHNESSYPAGSVPHEQEKLKTSASFTSGFVGKIKMNEDYSCIELCRCAKCSEIITKISRETHSIQSPRPNIITDPAWIATDYILDKESDGIQP